MKAKILISGMILVLLLAIVAGVKGQSYDEGLRLFNEGIELFNRSYFREAIDRWERALPIFRSLRKKQAICVCLGNLGNAYVELSEYTKAISYYKRAIKIAINIEDKEDAGKYTGNMGNAYLWLANYTKAISYYEQALKIARDINDRKSEGIWLGNLASAYGKLGNIPKAIKCYKETINIARDIHDRMGEGRRLGNLGVIYQNIGDLPEAISCYEKALKIARDIDDRKGEAAILGNLGTAYEEDRVYPKALSYYEKALRIVIELEDRMLEKVTKGNLGLAYLLKGDVTKAEDILKDAHPLRRGILYLYHNHPDRAIAIIKQFLNQDEEARISELIFGDYTALGLAYEMKGDRTEAARYFRKVADMVEEERERLSEGQKTHFFRAMPYFNWNRLTPYEGLIRISRDDEGFYYSEAIKARLLMEQVARKYKGELTKEEAGIPYKVREEEINISNHLASLYKQKDGAYKRDDKDAIKRLDKEIALQRDKRTDFITRLREQYPEYAAIRYPLPLNLCEIALKSGEVLIEYAVTEKETVAWLIRGKKIVKNKHIKINRKELEALIDRYREMISQPHTLTKATFDPELGRRLYGLLIEAFIPLIDQKEHIVIVPDKKLALLPFEALVTSCPREISYKKHPVANTFYYSVPGVTFLGDRYKLSYCQSASALTQVRTLKKALSGKERLLVLADPVFKLTDARLKRKTRMAKESKGISLCKAVENQMGLELDRLPLTASLAQGLKNLFGHDNTDLMIGIEASETALKKRDLLRYRYLVMATHGILDSHTSGIMEPALILSQFGNKKDDDGFLTISEVMDLRLGARIAALTACDTGRGRQLSGEGVMGLGRAFQYAGARSVLVSLWGVAEESTVRLAERFFSYMREGKDNIAALHLARQEIRQQGYDHPFFWAPFVLHGEWQ